MEARGQMRRVGTGYSHSACTAAGPTKSARALGGTGVGISKQNVWRGDGPRVLEGAAAAGGGVPLSADTTATQSRGTFRRTVYVHTVMGQSWHGNRALLLAREPWEKTKSGPHCRAFSG